jgi:hypothetical protein
MPGPLLRFKEGQRTVVDIFNDTDTPELVHWHGQIIPSDVDGAAEDRAGRSRYATRLKRKSVLACAVASASAGYWEVRGEQLVSAINSAVEQNGWSVTRHETALARVREAVNQIDAELAAAKAAGRLKFFNSGYKNYRLAAMARGEKFMTYGEANNRFRRAHGRADRAGDDQGQGRRFGIWRRAASRIRGAAIRILPRRHGTLVAVAPRP